MSKIHDFFKKFLDLKTLKFLLVGVLNTAVGMVIMLLLSALFNKFTPEFAARHLFTFGTTEYTASYLVSSIINYIAGGILSYFLNKYWTFKARSRSKEEVIKFIIAVLVCYAIAYLGAKPLTELMLKKSSMADKWKEFIALIIGAGLYTVLNYFAQRFFVFTKFSFRKKDKQATEGATVNEDKDVVCDVSTTDKSSETVQEVSPAEDDPQSNKEEQ